MQVDMPKLALDLSEVDGNAYALMAAFSRQAKKEGWKQQDIDTVLEAAQSGDYDNLVCVLFAHCDEPV